jgi:sugar lactone lactonase YvrE
LFAVLLAKEKKMRSMTMGYFVSLAALLSMAGGCGNQGGGISAVPATTSGNFMQPRDSVPSSDGTIFYFTATTSAGQPAVFKVPAAGGQATVVASGAPLVSPNSLAISSDDQTLFVTDSGGGNQIFTVPTGGGSASPLSGTSGTFPVGIEVGQSGGDLIYFTGRDVSSGKPGVFSIRPTGGTPSLVVEGAPLTTPGGVTVTSTGGLYVVNTPAQGQITGCIYQVSGGAASQFACGLHFGNPSGITLNLAQTTLLVSGGDDTGHDLVYTIALSTKAVATAADGISQNTNGGGVHRARNADIYSWADLTAGGLGTVYRIELK